MKFVCKFLEEMVILSDGGISTCCMDPLAENVYASIYEDTPESFHEKRQEKIRSIMTDPHSLQRCSKCIASQGDIPSSGNKRPMFFADPETAKYFYDDFVQGPKRAVIELTSICNLKCNGCMQNRYSIPSTRKEPLIDVHLLQEWMKNYNGKLSKIRLYNYGETFVHPKSLDFIEFLKSLGLYVEIATNGLLLDTEEMQRRLIASGVDRLLFSIHGGSQQGVEPYMTRAFDFEKIMNILERLTSLRAEIGTQVEIIWKYLLFEWNDSDEELQQAERLAREVGVDMLHFTLPGYPAPSRRFTGSPNRIVKKIFCSKPADANTHHDSTQECPET